MYETIKDELRTQGYSIRKLANKANIAPPDLCHALNGKKPFYPNWRKRVSAALGVPEDKLFPND